MDIKEKTPKEIVLKLFSQQRLEKVNLKKMGKKARQEWEMKRRKQIKDVFKTVRRKDLLYKKLWKMRKKITEQDIGLVRQDTLPEFFSRLFSAGSSGRTGSEGLYRKFRKLPIEIKVIILSDHLLQDVEGDGLYHYLVFSYGVEIFEAIKACETIRAMEMKGILQKALKIVLAGRNLTEEEYRELQRKLKLVDRNDQKIYERLANLDKEFFTKDKKFIYKINLYIKKNLRQIVSFLKS